MSKFNLFKPEEIKRKANEKVKAYTLLKTREDGLAVRKSMSKEEREKVDFELFHCISVGNTEDVKRLIKAGADVNFKYDKADGMTPLMEAAMDDNTANTSTLLFFKADVNARDKRGWTALMHAAINDEKSEEMIRLLLSSKAEIDARNNNGESALMVALRRGRRNAAKALLEGGANVNIQDGKGWTPLMNALSDKEKTLLALSGKPDLEMREKDGKTALRIAIDSGYTNVAELLLEKGADPAAGDKDGWTPAHSAIWEMNWVIMPIIYKKPGANYPEILLKNSEGLLHLCSSCGRAESVGLLMSLRRDDKGGKPLLDIDCLDSNGKTPLMHASSEGHPEVAKLLLGEGARLEIRDTQYGMTPLHWAAWQGHEKVVSLLLDAGAEIDAKDGNGETAIMRALSGGRPKVVELLIRRSANLHLRDRFGNSVVELGFRANPEIAGLFREHAEDGGQAATDTGLNAAKEGAAPQVAGGEKNEVKEGAPEKWHQALLSALKDFWRDVSE